MTILDEPAVEHDIYRALAETLLHVTEIDIEQAYTIIGWLEDEGLTDYDMVKEWYFDTNED